MDGAPGPVRRPFFAAPPRGPEKPEAYALLRARRDLEVIAASKSVATNDGVQRGPLRRPIRANGHRQSLLRNDVAWKIPGFAGGTGPQLLECIDVLDGVQRYRASSCRSPSYRPAPGREWHIETWQRVEPEMTDTEGLSVLGHLGGRIRETDVRRSDGISPGAPSWGRR